MSIDPRALSPELSATVPESGTCQKLDHAARINYFFGTLQSGTDGAD